MSADSVRGLEEERRLFYVAITRAEEHCYLSFAKSRFRFGKTEFSNPSRFLKDIDLCYLNLPQSEQMTRRVDEGASRFRSQMSASDASRPTFMPRTQSPNEYSPKRPDAQTVPQAQGPRHLKRVSAVSSAPSVSSSASVGDLRVGSVIEHERFGVGEVVDMIGAGDNCKATVKFRNAGVKQLLLKFARFKVIS